MSSDPEAPFDSVDGAHEYICLLCAAIGETRTALAEDVQRATRDGAGEGHRADEESVYRLRNSTRGDQACSGHSGA